MLYASGGCAGCSDVRWKTNVTPISMPLEKVMRLQGVEFNWRAGEYLEMFFSNGTGCGADSPGRGEDTSPRSCTSITVINT